MRYKKLKIEEAAEVESADNTPGEGEVGDGATPLADFIVELVLKLQSTLDVTAEEAVDAILDLADEMMADDEIPSLPEEGASAKEEAAWVGAARTAGMPERLMAACEEEDE